MDIQAYLDEVRAKYASGQATEHSYRPALQKLFESIDPELTVINEPKKSEAGMPDFLFQRKDVPFGWAEAKDIDKDVIRLKGYSVEQRERYQKAYPNLIYTNGVDFEFIREGEPVHFVSIADFMGPLGGLQPLPEKFDELERQLRLFAEQKPISIRSAAKLAEMMAAKAAIIKDELEIALKDDPEFRSGLGGQYKSFKANLLPHLTPDEFADLYAETMTYGMFAARFHDDDLSSFSRQEAMNDLPASNPFLKGLFEYIAGPTLPKRLEYIVDDLVQVMRASDPHSLFRDFGKFTARNDPFVHFYEDFLAAYNPKKRKSRGVWYTPEPVVDFIVRAVDDVLKTEFGLADGLADTSKVTVDWRTGTKTKGKFDTFKKEVHKVQILDPATGTGTFLAKVVQLIAERVKARASGKWSGYVAEDLLPRLHGFELLMASYAMCHMKLDMMLDQTKYEPIGKRPENWQGQWPPRLSVWLTNALEPAEDEVMELWFKPLADEARGAADVKRQYPIMCVIGNPPYSGESANKGDHIMSLMEAYKKEPGGKERLKERNPKWINDDYVKFIRMSEDLIARNPSGGILGFITNHGYLDNPTFRGMRWHLLKTFDKIWVLDLHGNAKKKEVSPDGSPDKNVFDIQQGVAIVIAARKGGHRQGLAEVCRSDLWGDRALKNEALWSSSLRTGHFKSVDIKPPHLGFLQRDHGVGELYNSGFSIPALFPIGGTGVVTKRDKLSIHETKAKVWEAVQDFLKKPEWEVRQKYSLPDDVRDWKYDWAKADLERNASEEIIHPISYRPFDDRFIYNSGQSRGFVGWPVEKVMGHFNAGPNVGICTARSNKNPSMDHFFITGKMMETKYAESSTQSAVFPLYCYPLESLQSDAFASTVRTSNLDPKLYAAICKAAGIDPANQAGSGDDFRAATGEARPSEVKVFDYIYGVLHSPAYRETFAEFLKIDFPRIPYPPSPEVFRHVSEKGERLRRLHLMEATAIGETPYPYEGDGDDEVASGFPKFSPSPSDGGGVERNEASEGSAGSHTPHPSAPRIKPGGLPPSPSKGEGLIGRVHINKDQYFAGVPKIAWEFRIGGYQPAQKWLKDRRGRTLSFEEVMHYQRIVKILAETDRIMKEIALPLD